MMAVGRRGRPAAWFRVEERVRRLVGEWAEAVPDLADPATGGVLLGWLPNYEVDKDERGARVRVGIGDDWQPARDVWSTTLGEAAARALLALWGPA